MGMGLDLSTLSDENIRKVLADPPLIWKVLAPDDPEFYEQARPLRPQSFFARLFGSRAAPPAATSSPSDFQLADGEVRTVDLDKAWHGLHYLLTGTDWAGEEPLNFLASGGTVAGDIDVGYGPARVLTSDEVQMLWTALQPITRQTLAARFNPTEMISLGIYPEIWDRDPCDDDTFDYCAVYFDDLKCFVARAASCRLGMVIRLA